MLFAMTLMTHDSTNFLAVWNLQALKLWLPVEFPTRNLSLKVESSAETLGQILESIPAWI